MQEYFSLEKTAALARRAAAEGCVLLKNENETLPLRKGDKVALFGRIAFSYYKSGLGSGGLVNTRYTVGILDALKAEPSIALDQPLLAVYEAWLRENPYDNGQGWGKVPWSQKEMPVSEELVRQAAARADVALVVLGRTAGEDQDIRDEAGSYRLTEVERDLVEKVARQFRRAAVLLNVGGLIELGWVEAAQVPAVLCVWQGGQEGGNGVCDLLTGRVCPCGRLTDTAAAAVADHPSSRNFGDAAFNAYQEDIYVGYRYFETFAPEKALYPFGFGLSYTRFAVEATLEDASGAELAVAVNVRNEGGCAGRESVLVYVEPPQGKLGKPARVLAGFAKTDLLQPGGAQQLRLAIPKARFASYDDGGATGHRSCWLLEAGTYRVYAGGDVRSAPCVGSFEQGFTVLEQREEAYAPTHAFTRMRPAPAENGYAVAWEPVPLRTVAPMERRAERLPAEIPPTGDRGIKLRDVYEGKAGLDAFVAQLSDEDLICIFRGEGMCSPKVTPGTAAAFGGVTERLRGFGIPAGCCADGPSGIRMDCGTQAFSLPNGTLLGCTFDTALVEQLYRMIGLELRKNRIDSLLGPGMNLHRSPLNGRNFEYISEDPLVTGLIAAAQLRGMNSAGVTGTVKHFCGNNQEFKRREANAEISERALRELYLKGFEIAVREGGCRSVMTTYGPVNGLWTAGSYDLNTTILRGEWGFDGIVMTDWWAAANEESGPGDMRAHAAMARAQNDIYMVTQSAADMEQDDLQAALQQGLVTRAELQRNAKNILSFLLRSLSLQYEMGSISQEELEANRAMAGADDVLPDNIHTAKPVPETGELAIDPGDWPATRGSAEVCVVRLEQWGSYAIDLTFTSPLNELAQLPISISLDNVLRCTAALRGTGGQEQTYTAELGGVFGRNHYIKFYFGADGIQLKKIRVRKLEGEPKF